ncbi:MAG TPA: hypothetical protein VF610_13485 [Segetibacter sp.]
MISFLYARKEYGPVPGSYNELTGQQLILIAELFAKALPKDLAELKALSILLNLSLYSFSMISADAKEGMLNATLPGDQKERRFIDWIFDRNTLTEQVLPFYNGFWGPAKEFENLTLSEFHFTEVYYREMMDEAPTLKGEESKISALDKLVAVLYRKPKPGYDIDLNTDGDVRQKFNANEVNYYANIIAGWPAEVKLAVLFFYDGCRQNLLENYDEIFNGDSGEDNEDGMFGIIRGLSGTKYGDIDKVEMLNIHTALYELTLQLKEEEKNPRPAAE